MSPGPHVRGEDGSAAQGSQERGPGRGRGGVSQGRRAEGGPRVALAGLRPGTGPARPPAHAQSPPRAATPACQVVSAQTTHAPHLAQVAGVGEGRRGFVAAAGMMRTDRFHNDRCHAPDRVHSLLRVPHFPAGLTESTRINPLSHVRLPSTQTEELARKGPRPARAASVRPAPVLAGPAGAAPAGPRVRSLSAVCFALYLAARCHSLSRLTLCLLQNGWHFNLRMLSMQWNFKG